MVRSMTGYGRGEATGDGVSIAVELRAVNNRYLDCTIKMPRAYLFAEDTMKEQIQAKVARGKVDVYVNLVHTAGDDTVVKVNRVLAKSYIDALKELYELDGGNYIKKSGYAADLAKFPDVLMVEKREEDQEKMKDLLLEALDAALTGFNDMREREGDKLAQDILSRGDTIEHLVEKVEVRGPCIVADYRARLAAKIAEVLQNTQIDESRILTEVAIYADKVAVDEETVRLHSHLSQLREMLKQGGSIGRKLDFLIQEFNREANTIGSKCNDIETSRLVVDIKAEIEKIREQIQNLE